MSELIKDVVEITKRHDSELPVSVGLYAVLVAMNEDAHTATDHDRVKAFVDEFQKALDDGYFADLRYDALDFTVSRVHIHTFPGVK